MATSSDRLANISYPLSGEIHSKVQSESDGDKTIRLVLIGRLVHYKGILELLDEIDTIVTDPNVKLDLQIIGAGPLEGKIRQKLSGKNYVHLLGLLDDDEKSTLLKASDALIVSSRTRGEAFNLTQLETIQKGLPIILRRLPSGTQDTAWKSKTVIRYNDGELKQAILKISSLYIQDFEHDKILFDQKYSIDAFRNTILAAFE